MGNKEKDTPNPDFIKAKFTPKVLLFDLGRVILDTKYKIFFQASRDLGVLLETINLCFTAKEYGDFARGKIDGHALCDAIRAITHVPNLTDEQIRDVHDKHIPGLVSGMVELLETVTQKFGADKIIFVTDTCDWQTARQQQLIDLSAYRVITSDEIGMLKSDPETVDPQGHKRSFFLSVLEKLDLQPQEALLIDDSPENIATARKYHLHAILFENKDQLEEILRTLNIL